MNKVIKPYVLLKIYKQSKIKNLYYYEKIMYYSFSIFNAIV